MAYNPLSLFCLGDGEPLSNAFPVEIEPTKTIGELKDLIKLKKSNRFHDVDADELTLWRVMIPDKDDDETPILLDDVYERDKKKLRATNKVSIFGANLPEETIHVIVQSPPPRPSSKLQRVLTFMDVIAEAGLTEKAVMDGQYDLSLLDKKEKVALLSFTGQDTDRKDNFSSLSRTSIDLHGANIKDMDKLSAPHGTLLPVVGMSELFIRRAYKVLHDTILGTFDNARAGNETKKHINITGTSGIGKSAFLVYFAVRLLAESADDEPPVIIFHTKRSSECYAFGGCSVVRSGDIKDFAPFLGQPDTWYIVDSSLDPVLGRAKTVIAASPKTLFSDQYKDVDKRVTWQYYMAPWNLEELTMCRTNVTSFQVVPLEAMEELYTKIGGVPRYVLERPTTVRM
ncbi:hypothetical protein BG004_003545 [Podila humilis]|nr:hypothetical protein BG004_003545 [Podila humilis]